MWEKLLSKKRYYSLDKIKESSNEEYYRSSFHRDYDRLIFSNSFRRLSRKTQVHPLSKNDHVHNRLTHSLEVASVGRSLGLKAGEILTKKYADKITVNPYDVAYMIQTACLAHDIGNPPFGHAGEEVIKEWFTRNQDKPFLKTLTQEEINDFQHLDGNAQSFRIVSQLENDLFEGGMHLTFATLGTLVKYPYTSTNCNHTGKSKFNCFQSEQNFFDILFSELGLKRKNGTYKRHPLSYLMEAADDICYALLDLQDAFALNIITLDDMKPIFSALCGEKATQKEFDREGYNSIKTVSKMVAISINHLAEHTMHVFEENLEQLCGDEQPKDLITLFSDEQLKKGILEAKKVGNDKIFNEKRKIELELGAYNIIETILDSLIPATFELYTKDASSLSFRNKRMLELMDNNKPEKDESLFKMYQRVVDYLVGMTDNYAKYIANQLNGKGV